jgi:cell division inhibitor SepF
MSNLVNKLKNWVAGESFDEDDYLMDDEPGYESVSAASSPVARQTHDYSVNSSVAAPNHAPTKKNLRVLEHPSSAMMAQVVVIEPHAFEEALDIIDHLKARKAVILNLHMLDTAQSQRVVDFLSGSTHALEGNQQRIGDGVFLFTPNNILIASELGRNDGLSLSDAYWNTPR